jgi:hypothetical protein
MPTFSRTDIATSTASVFGIFFTQMRLSVTFPSTERWGHRLKL